MKISAALALFSMAYIAGAVGTIQKTSQLTSTAAAIAVPQIPVVPLQRNNAPTLVTGGSQMVTTAASSSTNPLTPTVTQETTTQQTTGMQLYPGFSDGGYYNRYYPGGYPGYGGAYQSYLRWDYPGLNGGFHPGFFGVVRNGFLPPLYPGRYGLFGGAYLRYLSGVHPAAFDGAYGSFYGSQPFPSPYPVPGTGSYPAQGPVQFPGVSAATNIGTNAVSQSQVVASRVGPGSAAISGQQQNILPALPRVRFPSTRAE